MESRLAFAIRDARVAAFDLPRVLGRALYSFSFLDALSRAPGFSRHAASHRVADALGRRRDVTSVGCLAISSSRRTPPPEIEKYLAARISHASRRPRDWRRCSSLVAGHQPRPAR